MENVMSCEESRPSRTTKYKLVMPQVWCSRAALNPNEGPIQEPHHRRNPC
jgi:hypothetical protein